MTDTIEIEEIAAPHKSEVFRRLPAELYAGERGYEPPLDMLVAETLNPKQNPFFEHADVAYWVARRGDTAVGRISAQIDHLATPSWGGTVGYFGWFDTMNDPAVAAALLGRAEEWLREKGAPVVRGPFHHSPTEEVGLLVDGFEADPMIMMPWHAPWMGPLVEGAGYVKARDVLAYDYKCGTAREKHSAIGKAKEAGVTIRKLNPKDFAGDIARAVDIYNDAWSENWGFTPFTEKEVSHFASAMKPLVDPELIVIVEAEGKAIAMSICLPNLTEAAAGLDGKLFPFGFLPLLWKLKVAGVKTCRIPLMGVRKSYQGTVLGALIVRGMLETIDEAMVARKFERSELSWILEDNGPMRRVLQSIGASVSKTFRIYEKELV